LTFKGGIVTRSSVLIPCFKENEFKDQLSEARCSKCLRHAKIPPKKEKKKALDLVNLTNSEIGLWATSQPF